MMDWRRLKRLAKKDLRGKHRPWPARPRRAGWCTSNRALRTFELIHGRTFIAEFLRRHPQ